MLGYARFRQCAVAEGNGYHWVEADDFNLDNHLRRAVLPDPAGKAELQSFVADLASTPLNPSRPLWELHLVDTALGGQALIMRIHHSIADGMALVGVIMAMTDSVPDAPGPRAMP